MNDAILKRLDAIVNRLNEQDAAMDTLMSKIDRNSTLAAAAAQASEQALTALTSLSRRVSKLELPQ